MDENDNQKPEPFLPTDRKVLEFLKRNYKWLTWLICILLIVAGSYILTHIKFQGSKIEKISNSDGVDLTTIVNNQKNKFEKRLLDSLKVLDALVKNTPSVVVTQERRDSVRNNLLFEELQLTSAMLNDYIINKYNVDTSKHRNHTEKQFKDKNFEALLSYIPFVTVHVKSFFWLAGEEKYIEVLYFALFGVLCSLLYFCSEYLKGGTFLVQEVPVYWAKIFYAPLISLIIMFGLDQFAMGSGFNDSTTSLFLFSFLLGFFSGRAIELLNRVKDTIIPSKEVLEPKEPPVPKSSSQNNNEKFIIEGIVKFGDENILMEEKYEAVRIILADKDGNKTEIIPSTPGGYFKFTDLKDSDYLVEVTAEIDESQYTGKSGKLTLTSTNNVIKDVKIILNKN